MKLLEFFISHFAIVLNYMYISAQLNCDFSIIEKEAYKIQYVFSERLETSHMLYKPRKTF